MEDSAWTTGNRGHGPLHGGGPSGAASIGVGTPMSKI
jgi:hypothetical protein